MPRQITWFCTTPPLSPYHTPLCLYSLFFQYGCPDDNLGHRVGVTVGRWSSVLQVAVSVLGHLSWDSDAGSTVSHSGGEVMDAGRFVLPSQTSLVVLAFFRVVRFDVSYVMTGQQLDGFVYRPGNNWWYNDRPICKETFTEPIPLLLYLIKYE